MKRAEWDSIDASLCFFFLRGFWFRVLDVLKRDDDDDDDAAVVYTRRRRTVLTAMPIVAWGFAFQSLSRGTLNTSRADRCSQLVGHERFVSFPSARSLKKNADESLGASPRFHVHVLPSNSSRASSCFRCYRCGIRGRGREREYYLFWSLVFISQSP